MIKKIISTLLCLSMTLSSSAVFAADGTNLINVAVGKPISYGETGGAPCTYPIGNINDGDIWTFGELMYANGIYYPELIIDLEDEYSIEEIKLYAVPGNPSPDSRDRLWIDLSTDKSTWTNVCSRDNNVNDAFSFSQQATDTLVINDFGEISARYVRIKTFTYSVWEELEVYVASGDSSGGNAGGTPDDNTGNTPGTTPDGNPANTPRVQSDITLGDTSDAIPDDLKNISVGKGIDYDVTGGKPCTYPKENLVDGDTANLSELLLAENPAVPYPAYVVDLGQEYSISEIRLYAVNARSDGRNQIWIDYSADKENWYNVCATDSDSEAAGFVDLSKDVLIINNFGAPNARYVRMKTFSYALMSELSVFVEKPKLNDVTISGRTLTSAFSQNINPATVTADSFKVYADNVLLTLDTHYSFVVSGANVVVTLNKDYYDTEFKVEATTAIKNMIGDALTELTTDTVMAPPAVEIGSFEMLPPDGSGNVLINASIINNTSDVDTSAFVFAYLLDENNIVRASDYESYEIIYAGETKTPQLTIDTSEISGNCKVKAFLWKDLKSMQVWTASVNSGNLN